METAQDVPATSETQPLAEDQKDKHRQEHPPTPSSSAFTSAKDCHSKTKPPQLSDAQPKDILNWIKCNTNNPDEYPKGMRVLSRQHINYVTNGCGDHVILGSGSYGDVFLCRLVETGNLVALKLMKVSSLSIGEVIKECKMQFLFNFMNCTHLMYGVVGLEPSDVDMPLGILTEFIGDERTLRGYTLADVIYSQSKRREINDSQSISKKEWLEICIRLAKCLKRIHQKNVVINDLKADNILMRRISNTWIPFFIDFGLADFHQCAAQIDVDPSNADVFLATYSHIAPEYVLTKQNDNRERHLFVRVFIPLYW